MLLLGGGGAPHYMSGVSGETGRENLAKLFIDIESSLMMLQLSYNVSIWREKNALDKRVQCDGD